MVWHDIIVIDDGDNQFFLSFNINNDPSIMNNKNENMPSYF